MHLAESFTSYEKEKINRFLDAFINNFGDIYIDKSSKSFYVYRTYTDYVADYENYLQYCPNIDYLDGWLSGMIQGKNNSYGL